MTIVCGIDAGPGARSLLRVADVLAERLAARLVLLHVGRPAVIPGASAVPGAAEELKAVELERGHRLLAALCESERRAGPAERRVALGSPASVIAAIAEEEHADLIVVGSRGRGSLAAAFLGSVSARLSGCAPCPVVVVPPVSRPQTKRAG
jgi:nucleotide-binding universal stress UspA family protein